MISIMEWISYVIIGLACFLTVGGAIFLAAVEVYERIENWQMTRVGRTVGRSTIPPAS